MQNILTVNGGSSSIRFAVYEKESAHLHRRLSGKIDRIGAGGTRFSVDNPTRKPRIFSRNIPSTGYLSAVVLLLDWLEEQTVFQSVKAIGHRIVQGMRHSAPELVTAKLLKDLRRIARYDPDHLPGEIALIDAISQRHPNLPQVACFDTAFHRTMPPIARMLPIPRRYGREGIERYGFHGLSFAYLSEELTRIDPEASKGRVILAHLGSGASMAAVKRGKSIDTSMGFTPAAGLMMSTRTGDLDPGLVYYLARRHRMTAAQFQQMVNHESGLLGVSGISSDMRDLLARRATDMRAAESVALFCYQAKKWIGSFAAVLGGLQTLVFSGGIGESAPFVREQICSGLDFIGIKLSRQLNRKNAAVISTPASAVTVRVMRTDEEMMIARTVSRICLEKPAPKSPRSGHVIDP